MKKDLVQAPILLALEPGDDLFMYLSISKHAVSAVLMNDQGIQ